MKKVFVIVSNTCADCGNKNAVKLQSTKPTNEDIKATKTAIWGMSCIETNVFEAEIDGEIITNEDN
jgi:hypothetical protein